MYYYRTYWSDSVEWAHFGRLHSVKEHHDLGLALDLSDCSRTQFLMLDETSKAGPRVEPSNHSQDGQYWAMGHHISFKLRMNNTLYQTPWVKIRTKQYHDACIPNGVHVRRISIRGR